MRSIGSWASPSCIPIQNSAGRSSGNPSASTLSAFASEACSVAAASSSFRPCSVASTPWSSFTTCPSLSFEGSVHVDALMAAGPSRVGLNVCKVSIPIADCVMAVGTARSGHWVRTCSTSISTPENTGHTFLRYSVQLMYVSRSTSSALCLPTSAAVIVWLLKHTDRYLETSASDGGNFCMISSGRGWVSRIVLPTKPFS